MIDLRVWRRRVKRVFRPFLREGERARVAAAIAAAEKATTGEIRVHVIAHSRGRDMLALARGAFDGLGLAKTRERNGVLILVSHLDHRWAIWGDSAINDAGGEALWEGAGRVLEEHFRDNRYAEGLEACVKEVGRVLAAQFPAKGTDNPNELSNNPTEG